MNRTLAPCHDQTVDYYSLSFLNGSIDVKHGVLTFFNPLASTANGPLAAAWQNECDIEPMNCFFFCELLFVLRSL